MVAVDDTAFAAVERRQPLPREYLARVLAGIGRSGAAVIGLDVALETPTSVEADAALAATLRELSGPRATGVVVVGDLPREGPLAATDLLAAVVRASPAVPIDADGLIRRIDPVVNGADGRNRAAFALAVAARRAGIDSASLHARVDRGEPWAVPTPEAGRVEIVARPRESWPINFVGPAGTFLTISSEALAALADPGAEAAADNPLRGRIVLVGGTFREGRDTYQTPHGPMPGVEVHANVVHMLATGRVIRPSGWLMGLAIQAAVVLTAGVVFLLLRPLAATLVCLSATLALGIPASAVAFQRGGYWIDFLIPVLATCLMGLATDLLARRRLRDSFGRYVSREVMAQVEADAPSLRGERRQVSVLFSDLRGFTTLSERTPVEEIAARLDEYFDAMTRAIFAERGTVNDFVGDAVMAVFGAPLDDDRHALRAVRSALAMTEALAGLNRRWAASGIPELRMGIGLHTGTVFAGDVGGRERVKYTVVGDAVNVASRVEGLTKDLGAAILLTEETLRAAGGAVVAKERGVVAVKGRAEPVRVWELVGIEDQGEGRRSR